MFIHELCHLIHYSFAKKIFELQTKEIPDWEKLKIKLEKLGEGYFKTKYNTLLHFTQNLLTSLNSGYF